ncbi:MAG: Nif3-like dinuclear metal center hexameric protein [Victivallaceae bacterium]|nr:Nif3-like dinuclear metal center hexameric protein [Victivallaceae bacterium]
MLLKDVTAYLDRELRLAEFPDDCSNNGLQAESGTEVTKAVFGVDACAELFEMAGKAGADFVFVHHGLSWGPGVKRLSGLDGARFGTLFRNGISLYAAHLPLDANPDFGNNAVLCRMLEMEKTEPFFEYRGVKIGFDGLLPKPAKTSDIATMFKESLGADVKTVGTGIAKHVAVVSGGGGLDSVIDAAAAGADTLVTGELEHIMFHAARELGIKVIAIGHYASETTGPRALMEKFAEDLGIESAFADLPTGL